jgi:hypothetical protein
MAGNAGNDSIATINPPVSAAANGLHHGSLVGAGEDDEGDGDGDDNDDKLGAQLNDGGHNGIGMW